VSSCRPANHTHKQQLISPNHYKAIRIFLEGQERKKQNKNKI
jgi:hypothetical protein